MYMVLLSYTEQDTITIHGMEDIIIQDRGRGDSTSGITHGTVGVLDLDTAGAGLILDLAGAVVGMADGGDPLIIILVIIMAGMAEVIRMDTMEVILFIIRILMCTTTIISTRIEAVSQPEVISGMVQAIQDKRPTDLKRLAEEIIVTLDLLRIAPPGEIAPGRMHKVLPDLPIMFFLTDREMCIKERNRANGNNVKTDSGGQ